MNLVTKEIIFFRWDFIVKFTYFSCYIKNQVYYTLLPKYGLLALLLYFLQLFEQKTILHINRALGVSHIV